MKLHIAGGCGEHGRNCFFVNAGEQSFMVDCGIAKGSSNPFPGLTKEEIQKCSVLFLTHSHSDHTGAIEWIKNNGFTGDIIASEETLKQIRLSGEKVIPLESVSADKKGSYKGIGFRYGRSGHCIGSVWYCFDFQGKCLLFTGDYHEDSCYYQCDKIRNIKADLAVIDCAYGWEKKTYRAYLNELVKFLESVPDEKTIVLPVPEYGRGQEIARELGKRYNNIEIYGDIHYCRETKKSGQYSPWISDIRYADSEKKDFGNKKIMFISDPQLKEPEHRNHIEDILNNGGYAVMTGHADSHSFSAKLIELGKMKQVRFPVHMNYQDYLDLCEKNRFHYTILFHSEDFCEREFYDI